MRALLVLTLLCLPVPAGAGTDCGDGRASSVQVAAVDARLDLALADGRIAYFPDLEPPRATPAEPERPRRVAGELLTLLRDGAPKLKMLGPTDRWGRMPVRIQLENGDGADEILAAGGLAMVSAAAAPCAEAARAAEAQARADRLGLWSDPAFAVLDAAKTEDFFPRAGTLALVEGRVTSIGHSAPRLYLNFGRGRGDFSASISKRNWPTFQRAGFTEALLREKRLRLRGIVEIGAAPQIELFHPGQIEFMEEQPADAAGPSQ